MNMDPLQDQIDAAAAEAGRFAAGVFREGTVNSPSGWIEQVADDFLRAYLGDPRRCEHLGSPRPTFGSLSQMGVMRCLPCFTSWFSEDAWSACNRCGQVGDTTVSAVTMGPIVVVLCLCNGCHGVLLAEQLQDHREEGQR
ncbi:hypothetical protein B0I32_106279 [Nonomuraea fuscirosea]|uniref:Uncharacterized protein n=1 Tax=Nonomuraea fuscirosea TaxID=1291556 RepID=A0A2T0N2D6_9ACTN|nr:hypothetical protein [Nonomuraea fuscirosea]PRX66143.1 hypothetical protein B0I32_106279 [Nonomuraea fuscirosea]